MGPKLETGRVRRPAVVSAPARPTNPGGIEAYILNVHTRPDARRLGLARALMNDS